MSGFVRASGANGLACHTRKSERWGHGDNKTGTWVKWQSNQERGVTAFVPEHSRGVSVIAAQPSKSLPADLLRGLAGRAFWTVGAHLGDRVARVGRAARRGRVGG